MNNWFSINWRRGLFRMWIAASFVWLVIVGAFLQADIRREVSVLMTTEIVEPLEVPDPVLLEALEALRAAERAGNEEDMRRLAEIAIRLRQAQSKSELRASLELRQRAQGELIVFASVLLLPPLFAFALGWAGLWILKGFRS